MRHPRIELPRAARLPPQDVQERAISTQSELAAALRLERDRERQPGVLNVVLDHILATTLGPHHRRVRARDAGGLPRQAEPLSRLAKAHRIAELADDVKHHVHVAEGNAGAFLRKIRLLGQNVEVEAEAVPGEKRVSVVGPGGELLDHRAHLGL